MPLGRPRLIEENLVLTAEVADEAIGRSGLSGLAYGPGCGRRGTRGPRRSLQNDETRRRPGFAATRRDGGATTNRDRFRDLRATRHGMRARGACRGLVGDLAATIGAFDESHDASAEASASTRRNATQAGP